MATQFTKVLVRNADSSPALWIDEVRTELLHDDGRSSISFDGTTLNDANTSIPFDPSIEDVELVAEEWKASFGS